MNIIIVDAANMPKSVNSNAVIQVILNFGLGSLLFFCNVPRSNTNNTIPIGKNQMKEIMHIMNMMPIGSVSKSFKKGIIIKEIKNIKRTV
jgi:hypothetical protein